MDDVTLREPQPRDERRDETFHKSPTREGSRVSRSSESRAWGYTPAALPTASTPPGTATAPCSTTSRSTGGRQGPQRLSAALRQVVFPAPEQQLDCAGFDQDVIDTLVILSRAQKALAADGARLFAAPMPQRNPSPSPSNVDSCALAVGERSLPALLALLQIITAHHGAAVSSARTAGLAALPADVSRPVKDALKAVTRSLRSADDAIAVAGLAGGADRAAMAAADAVVRQASLDVVRCAAALQAVSSASTGKPSLRGMVEPVAAQPVPSSNGCGPIVPGTVPGGRVCSPSGEGALAGTVVHTPDGRFVMIAGPSGPLIAVPVHESPPFAMSRAISFSRASEPLVAGPNNAPGVLPSSFTGGGGPARLAESRRGDADAADARSFRSLSRASPGVSGGKTGEPPWRAPADLDTAADAYADDGDAASITEHDSASQVMSTRARHRAGSSRALAEAHRPRESAGSTGSRSSAPDCVPVPAAPAPAHPAQACPRTSSSPQLSEPRGVTAARAILAHARSFSTHAAPSVGRAEGAAACAPLPGRDGGGVVESFKVNTRVRQALPSTAHPPAAVRLGRQRSVGSSVVRAVTPPPNIRPVVHHPRRVSDADTRSDVAHVLRRQSSSSTLILPFVLPLLPKP